MQNPTGIPNDPSRLGFDTGPGAGSVQRVRFVGGGPLLPGVLQDALDFPDGLGIASPPVGAAGAQAAPEPHGAPGGAAGLTRLALLYRRRSRTRPWS